MVDDSIMSKMNSSAADGWLFQRDDVGGVSGRTDMYLIYLESSAAASTATRIEGATNSSPLGVWTHVCTTIQLAHATGLRLYVNGREDANSPTSTLAIASLNAGTNPLFIGYTSEPGPRPFNGLIDDVRIYKRVLSAGEVKMLYRGFPSISGLVGYWPLIGNTTGTFEPDFSGNKNHGTRVGGVIRGALSPFKRFFMSVFR